MVMGKVARQRGRANLFGCVIQLVALPFAVALVASIALCASVAPMSWAPALMVLGPLAILGLIALFVGPIVFVIHRRRTRLLDAAFGHVGPGRQTSIAGRGWAGTRNGREVNVWFADGPSVQVYLSGATAGAGQDNALARAAAGLTGRELESFDDVVVGSPDTAFLRRFLDRTGVRGALATLLAEDHRSLRSVLVNADYVLFQQRYPDLGALGRDQTDQWLDALDVVAAAAEAAGPTDPPATPGLLAGMRTSRGSLGRFLAILAGITASIVVCSGALSVVLVLLANAV